VASGLHDVDACLIGTGAQSPGVLSIIAGSFSINQTVSDRPALDERWLTRAFIEPGSWLHLGVSPASASNLEWFARELWRDDTGDADRQEVFRSIERGVRAASGRPREVWYLPFLYGSPIDNQASAAFVGLRGWHSRDDMARALFEGVVFNHLWHIDALRSAFSFRTARLTGGGCRSSAWSQMFSDAVGIPVVTTECEESGALGAAMCAGIAIGRYASIDEAAAALVRVRHTFEPDPRAAADLAEAMSRYRTLAASLGPFWRGTGGD
jgi:L-xylulokinase